MGREMGFPMRMPTAVGMEATAQGAARHIYNCIQWLGRAMRRRLPNCSGPQEQLAQGASLGVYIRERRAAGAATGLTHARVWAAQL